MSGAKVPSNHDTSDTGLDAVPFSATFCFEVAISCRVLFCSSSFFGCCNYKPNGAPYCDGLPFCKNPPVLAGLATHASVAGARAGEQMRGNGS